jgi:hypothetical protein
VLQRGAAASSPSACRRFEGAGATVHARRVALGGMRRRER